MKHSAEMLFARRNHSFWLRTFVLAFCGLLLLSFAVPRAGAVLTDSTAQSVDLAQNSTSATQAKRQEERREEIKQRKIDNPEAEDGENVYRHSAMVHTLARVFGLSVEATSRIFETVSY